MTPSMTLAHLVFALATTAYIVLAIQFEERDLGARARRRLPGLPPRGADAAPDGQKRRGVSRSTQGEKPARQRLPACSCS